MAENGFCRYCGNKVTSDNRFCPNCGANSGSQFGVGSDNVNTSNFQNINYNKILNEEPNEEKNITFVCSLEENIDEIDSKQIISNEKKRIKNLIKKSD